MATVVTLQRRQQQRSHIFSLSGADIAAVPAVTLFISGTNLPHKQAAIRPKPGRISNSGTP